MPYRVYYQKGTEYLQHEPGQGRVSGSPGLFDLVVSVDFQGNQMVHQLQPDGEGGSVLVQVKKRASEPSGYWPLGAVVSDQTIKIA